MWKIVRQPNLGHVVHVILMAVCSGDGNVDGAGNVEDTSAGANASSGDDDIDGNCDG